MARPLKSGKHKDAVVAFRLAQDEFAPFEELLLRSSMNKSEFFRSIFLSNDKQVTLKERRPVDYQRLLYVANKAGNNLNQIAKQLNVAHKTGSINELDYRHAINQLVSINECFKGILNAL